MPKVEPTDLLVGGCAINMPPPLKLPLTGGISV